MLQPILLLLPAALVAVALCDDLGDFFPAAKGNLTKVTWAHAVNNYTLLQDALKSDVMMLEADVSLGSVGNRTNIPVMAHPPATKSDISLEQFLANVSEHNAKHTPKQKGIKLDFKSYEAFNKSVDILKSATKDKKYPVWLNADIIAGPVNATTHPVDATKFLTTAKQFPSTTLSIGWTTAYNATFATNYSYTEDQINNMMAALTKNNLIAGQQTATFPVRAGLAAESLAQMQRILDTVKNATLTVWSSVGDPVNVDNLNALILKLGVDRVYVDVPEELAKRLNLGSSSNRAAHLGIFSVALATLIMLLTSKML